jgi:hypothetical protein
MRLSPSKLKQYVSFHRGLSSTLQADLSTRSAQVIQNTSYVYFGFTAPSKGSYMGTSFAGLHWRVREATGRRDITKSQSCQSHPHRYRGDEG